MVSRKELEILEGKKARRILSVCTFPAAVSNEAIDLQQAFLVSRVYANVALLHWAVGVLVTGKVWVWQPASTEFRTLVAVKLPRFIFYFVVYGE